MVTRTIGAAWRLPERWAGPLAIPQIALTVTTVFTPSCSPQCGVPLLLDEVWALAPEPELRPVRHAVAWRMG